MPPRTDDSRAFERRFFEVTGARRAIRIAVRAIVMRDEHILVQRGVHPDSVRWFPGGELEFGESLETGIRRELAEESSLNIKTVTYRFAANNRFERDGYQYHLLEHYFEVMPASMELETLEDHFEHEWIPISDAGSFDIRPVSVRDILGVPGWRTIRLLEVS